SCTVLTPQTSPYLPGYFMFHWDNGYYYSGLSGTLTLTDSSGTPRNYNVYFGWTGPWGGYYSTQPMFNYWSPVVLDLDGNGIDLVSANSMSAPWFDMDGDGYRDQTGWVGPNDGILVIDRDGDGLITKGEEISFSRDENGAVSDLEGLRAYDTNQNGMIDASDAQFSELRVWQDANQDGICEAGELTTLAERSIAAINLTLTPTGNSLDDLTDNVIYGTTQFLRSDGSTGLTGDVALLYHHNGFVMQIGDISRAYHIDPTTRQFIPDDGQPNQIPSELLGPIVLDLDGDGVSLLSRTSSNVYFDMDKSGIRQRTGWVGPNDGLLVLDRNGDGKITDGSEISFKDDLPGAVSDLEGLRAYDTNQNGFFDEGDARFSDFRVWRDANQNGVCGSSELKTLASYGITAINLTQNLTGQTIEGASDNVLYATADVLHGDGSVSGAGDVFLAYDQDPEQPKEISQGEQANLLIQAKQSLRSPWMSFNTPRVSPNGPPQDALPASGANDRDENASGIDAHNPGQPSDGTSPDDRNAPWRTILAAGHGAGTQSALESGLGVVDRKVLQMVSAMSTFNSTAPGNLEQAGHRQRPKGMEYLTALPDLHAGTSLHAA
ncbi:MAG TPA: hypothetical protein VGC27_12825, partial [Rhizomicrobium sp.]